MGQKTKPLGLVLPLTAASIVLTMLVWLFDAGTAEAGICDVPSDTHDTIQKAVDDSSCDTINLTARLYIENVNVSRSVTIQGRTVHSTSVEGSVFGSVFFIQAGHAVTLSKMTISNGWANTGGGIRNEGSAVVINSCLITNNRAYQGGGGIYNTSGGITTITNCTVSFNDSDSRGAGIYNQDGILTISDSAFITNTGGSGGAIYNSGGAVTVQNSVLSGNSSGDESGGAIYLASGTITITDSAITNNFVDIRGGGVFIVEGMLATSATVLYENDADIGGGIYNELGEVEIVNSEFVSNSAHIGAGIANAPGGTMFIAGSTLRGNAARNGAGMANIGVANIVNSTLSENSANFGGGIENRESGISPDVGILTITNSTFNGNSGGGIYNWENAIAFLSNSIIANSSGGDCAGEGNYISVGHNLVSDDTCNLVADGDLPSTSPMLGPLGDNGGGTMTHALLLSSPAIDAGDNAVCAAPPVKGVDQRRVARPQGPACDIGSFEAIRFVTLLPIMLR